MLNDNNTTYSGLFVLDSRTKYIRYGYTILTGTTSIQLEQLYKDCVIKVPTEMLFEYGDISSTSGENIENANRIRAVEFIEVTGGTKLYLRHNLAQLSTRLYNSNKEYVSSESVNNFNLSENISYIRFISTDYNSFATSYICINDKRYYKPTLKS